MSRKACLAALVAVSLGCGGSGRPSNSDTEERSESAAGPSEPQAANPTGAKAERMPVPPTRPTVSVGQPLKDAVAALAAAGAEDFSSQIGVFIGVPFDPEAPRREMHWFMLTGRTCLCLYARAENARGAWIVDRLVLGEEGQGYGGKERWPSQKHRVVERLELP